MRLGPGSRSYEISQDTLYEHTTAEYLPKKYPKGRSKGSMKTKEMAADEMVQPLQVGGKNFIEMV